MARHLSIFYHENDFLTVDCKDPIASKHFPKKCPFDKHPNSQHKLSKLMAEALKIAAASWTDLDENSLDMFSTTASLITSVAADYPLVIPQATSLTLRADNYHKSLSRYQQFGGTDNKDQKDLDKSLLYKAHEEMATKLEETADGDEYYMTRPGYRLDLKGSAKTAVINKPRLQKAISEQVRGRVKFILKADDPREIKGVVGRRSLDNGVTWENGIYNFGLKVLLEDQPSGQAVLYQFMFMATYGRKSDWSEVFRVEIF